jgi:hypothetical protein
MALLTTPSTESGRAPRRRATATWIRALGSVAVLAATATVVLLAAAAGAVRDELGTLGHDTAPQVTATQDLSFALSDMDGQLANVLLGDDRDRVGPRSDYDRDRIQADADLQQATTVAGADAESQRTVREVLDRFGQYQALAAQAMSLNEREHNPAGRPSADVLDLQREATDYMRSTLDTVRTLTERNSSALERSYQARRATTVAARWWLAGLGGLLVVGLIGLQVVLRLRMRRWINPPIAIATILAGWLVISGLGLMAGESEHLRVAKEDAFGSLVVLRQARAVSYDAFADESRYLLDQGRAGQYEKAFLDKSESVAGVPADDLAGYEPALTKAWYFYEENHPNIPFTGFFGAELHNTTFPGEVGAIERALTLFRQYQMGDNLIRRVDQPLDARRGIKFSTVDADFQQYDRALSELIGINQTAFDDAIFAGESDLAGWTGWIPYGAGGLILILVVAGAWPRLAEFR